MPVSLELLIGLAGAVLTVLLLSYLFGDTVLYRWALAVLVGVGAGYAMALVLGYLRDNWLVLMMDPNQSADLRLYYAIPLLLGALLLFKGFPRFSRLGNVSMAILLGSGVAVAFSGALLGTVIPQIDAAGSGLSLKAGLGNVFNGLLVLAGTIIALLGFSPRPEPQIGQARTGQIWIKRISRYLLIIGLAVAYAGALTSSLIVLVNRLAIMTDWLFSLLNIGL